MSTKFEQLLDLIVNEEMDKANELFHSIVVEKSRDIYENLIAEEAEADATAGEDPEIEEGEEGEEEPVEENMDLEDSYSMEADDEDDQMPVQDKTDDFDSDIDATDRDDTVDMDSEEGTEENAIMDIKNAIEELEAAFAELEQAKGMGGDMDSDFGDHEKPETDGDMMGGSDDMMGKPAFEGRRMTREYVEKVGNDWEKSGSQKSQGQYAGAGTGDKDSAPVEGRSTVSSGKGKPVTGATAGNLNQSYDEGGTPTGTSPAGKAGGFLSAAKDMNTGNGNVPGGKMGIKNLSAVKGGHGAEKKGSGPGPVGSGTGDKAGQTSVGQVKSPINGAPNRNA